MSLTRYLAEAGEIIECVSETDLDTVTSVLRDCTGRVFVCGLGGSSATASHFAADLRKLCNIEAYCPTDNQAEFSARMNDEGPESVFTGYLKASNCMGDDVVFIISVGGGSDTVSAGLTNAAKLTHPLVVGIVGRYGGAARDWWDAGVVIPNLYPERVTPHTEGIASVLLHAIVTELQVNKTKW